MYYFAFITWNGDKVEVSASRLLPMNQLVHGCLEFTFTTFITRQARTCSVADKLNTGELNTDKYEKSFSY